MRHLSMQPGVPVMAAFLLGPWPARWIRAAAPVFWRSTAELSRHSTAPAGGSRAEGDWPSPLDFLPRTGEPWQSCAPELHPPNHGAAKPTVPRCRCTLTYDAHALWVVAHVCGHESSGHEGGPSLYLPLNVLEGLTGVG